MTTSKPVSTPATDGAPDDEASSAASQTAENTCRECGGTGRIGHHPCPACDGRGTVTVTVGDA